MFSISCNAFGDIVAVVQIVRDIAKALNESRGAAQDYRDFARGLESMATVMEEAYRVAHTSSNFQLREAILRHVRLCCIEIQRASERTSGFEALLSTRTPIIANIIGLRDLFARRTKMLQWHFMRSSEAAEFMRHFHDQCLLIQFQVILLNESSARIRAQRQEAHADVQLSIIRDDLAHLSESSFTRLDHLTRGLRRTDHSESFGQLAAQIHRQHSAILHATMQSDSEVIRTLSQQSRMMDRTLQAVNQSTSQPEGRMRFVSSIFPIFVSWLAVFAVNAGLISPQTRWHVRILWASLCTVVIHSIWVQCAAIPRTISYTGENSIIFIDFVGSRMHLPLQLCGTMADFHSFLEWLFTNDGRKGRTFVLRQSYEILESSSATALTEHTWSDHVTEGVILELGILLRQQCREKGSLSCPYCHAETMQDPSSEPRDVDWLSCMGCRRPFQVSTTQLPGPSQDAATNLPGSSAGTHGQDSSRSTAEDHASEDIHELGRIHVMRVLFEERTGGSSSETMALTKMEGNTSSIEDQDDIQVISSSAFDDTSATSISSTDHKPNIETTPVNLMARNDSDVPSLRPLPDDANALAVSIPSLTPSQMPARTPSSQGTHNPNDVNATNLSNSPTYPPREAIHSTPTLMPSASSTPKPVPPAPNDVDTTLASSSSHPPTRQPSGQLSEPHAQSSPSPSQVISVQTLRSTDATNPAPRTPSSLSPIPRRRSVVVPRRTIKSLGLSSAGLPVTPRGTDMSVSPPPLTPNRKRRPSETANVDLSRVLEEEGESTARTRNPDGERAERIRLGKGKWPDDFMDRNAAPPPSSSPPRASPPLSLSPLSLSPSRNLPLKVAIIDSSGSPTSELAPPSRHRPARRAAHTPTRIVGPPEADAIVPDREHAFVKTSFSKPVICRVCMQHVEKSAVLCSKCSLITHSRCAAAATATCDLRSQLLLYAQSAKGETLSKAASDAPTSDNMNLPDPPPSSAGGAENLARPATADNISRRRSHGSLSPGPSVRNSSIVAVLGSHTNLGLEDREERLDRPIGPSATEYSRILRGHSRESLSPEPSIIGSSIAAVLGSHTDLAVNGRREVLETIPDAVVFGTRPQKLKRTRRDGDCVIQ